MPTIESNVSKYIDLSIERAMKKFKVQSKQDSQALLKEFNENSKRHMFLALEGSKNNLKELNENSKRHMFLALEGSKNNLKELNENSKRHMSVILGDFKNSLKAFKEIAPKIPTEERIREIVHEEIHPMDTKLNICLAEIREHRKELDKHEESISSLELEVV